MIIDGNGIANQIQNEIKASIAKCKGRAPFLAVIIIGNHPASLLYVKRKRAACENTHINSKTIHLSESILESDVINTIKTLNQDENVDGILLQLPLPSHLDPLKITPHIAVNKDVDGLNPYNVGKMLMGDQDTFFPCTPLGIKEMLIRSHVDISGKHVVILGRSNLVGKPMAAILMQNQPDCNATVTIAHSKTEHLQKICQSADILIAAIGRPHFVTADMVKEGAVVIDVGINKIASYETSSSKIVGDVDFESVKNKCAHITPVPGGVGPMTIAMLLANTFKSYLARGIK